MASVIVATIYPIAVVERRSQFQPQNEYALPACAPGEIEYLEVKDADISEYMGLGRTMPRKINALDIANDIVKCFTRNFPSISRPDICHPGIWVCSGRTATAKERAENEEIQNEFGRHSITEADVFHGKQRPDLITRRHHALAEWMGVKGRPWQERIDRSAKEACVFCGAMNPAFVSICGTCRNILNFERYNATQAAIRDGKHEDVRAAVQAARNASANDLAEADLDEVLREHGLAIPGAGKAKG